MLAGTDGMILSGQPEGVETHWMEHPLALPTHEVRDGVADGIVLEVTDVGFTAGVGKHFQDIDRVRRVGVIVHHPGLLFIPHLCPVRINSVRIEFLRCVRRRHQYSQLPLTFLCQST
jgi:hypothetical protein